MTRKLDYLSSLFSGLFVVLLGLGLAATATVVYAGPPIIKSEDALDCTSGDEGCINNDKLCANNTNNAQPCPNAEDGCLCYWVIEDDPFPIQVCFCLDPATR